MHKFGRTVGKRLFAGTTRVCTPPHACSRAGRVGGRRCCAASSACSPATAIGSSVHCRTWPSPKDRVLDSREASPHRRRPISSDRARLTCTRRAVSGRRPCPHEKQRPHGLEPKQRRIGLSVPGPLTALLRPRRTASTGVPEAKGGAGVAQETETAWRREDAHRTSKAEETEEDLARQVDANQRAQRSWAGCAHRQRWPLRVRPRRPGLLNPCARNCASGIVTAALATQPVWQQDHLAHPFDRRDLL